MLTITIINLLILFFGLLIFYQMFLAPSIEGMTTGGFQPYDTNNPNNALILSQQNAGNIQVLKQQIDDLSSLKTQVKKNGTDIENLQKQVEGIIASQQQYAKSMTPDAPPKISGAVE